ncbi:alpha/beta hydrolase, partial [Clostridioides difficile]|nr:alpha/beta hydrolase [Clostridioides difficile]
MYKEVGISSNNVPITLSIWYTERNSPTIVFLPGTMSHPLMYENFLCGLS